MTKWLVWAQEFPQKKKIKKRSIFIEYNMQQMDARVQLSGLWITMKRVDPDLRVQAIRLFYRKAVLTSYT